MFLKCKSLQAVQNILNLTVEYLPTSARELNLNLK